MVLTNNPETTDVLNCKLKLCLYSKWRKTSEQTKLYSEHHVRPCTNLSFLLK